MIELKTPKEIEAMKPAGRFVGGILRDLKEFTKVGTNLLEIDEFVHKRIVDRKGDPHRPRLVQNLMKTGLCDYAQPVFSCPF